MELSSDWSGLLPLDIDADSPAPRGRGEGRRERDKFCARPSLCETSVILDVLLQENIRWKALDEICNINMFLHRSDLNISANFRFALLFIFFAKKR